MTMTMMPMMTKVGWVSERAVLGEAENDHVKLYQHSSMVINLQVCLLLVHDLFIVCLLFVRLYQHSSMVINSQVSLFYLCTVSKTLQWLFGFIQFQIIFGISE